VIIFLIVTFPLVYCLFASQYKPIKLICLNLICILLTLALFEGYLQVQKNRSDRPQTATVYPRGYIQDHPILGYAPRPSNRITLTKQVKGELVYEAVYTINGHGLRLSPKPNESDAPCILFFGGSYTFGAGVSDQYAMPYQVGIKSNKQYKIYNFGFHGYGPHQMLAAIEHGIVANIVKICTVKTVIYQAIPGHVRRSAGLASWDRYGPKFVLQDGRVYHSGNFSSNLILAYIRRGLSESLIYNNLRRTKPNGYEIDLYVEIVTRAKTLLTEQYLGSEFHVLLWEDDGHELYPTLARKLTENGLQLHKISETLPEDDSAPLAYKIHQYDGHPNEQAHELIADYVLLNVLQ